MSTATALDATLFLEIPLDRLVESRWNPRKHFDDGTLQDLAASIREKGVIEPIVVRPQGPHNGTGGTCEIVAGTRRFRASKMAGRESIPAIVRVVGIYADPHDPALAMVPRPVFPRGVCKGCGCTWTDPCPQGCAWADPTETVCTECVGR